MKKQLRQLVNTAEDQGWVLEMTSKGHWKFIPPKKDQRILFISSTPSGFRAWTNFRKELQRHGLKI